MRKAGLIVAIIVVLLGAAVLAGPRLLIRGAEDQLRASTEALSQPFAYRMKLNSFEPGWFSSEAVTVIELSGYYAELYDQSQAELDLPFDPPHLELNHVIRHGPLIWTDDGLTLAASLVETTLQTPVSLQPHIGEIFGDQALLTVKTAVAFDGTTLSEFSSPPRVAPADPASQTVDAPWPGIAGTVATSGKAAKIEAQVPAWSVSGTGGGATLSPINLASHLERFRDITWIGDFWLTMDRIDVKAGPAGPSQPFSISGIRYGGATREENGLLHMNFEAGIAGGEGQGATLGANAYRIAIKNVDADSFAAFYQAAYKMMEAGGENLQGQLMTLYGEQLPNLLTGSEILSLGLDYDFTTPQMQMSGASSVKLGSLDGDLGAQLELKLAKTRFGDIALDAGDAKVALTGLSADSLAELWQEMMRAYAAALADPSAGAIDETQLETLTRGLITKDTMLTIDPFKVSLPTGELTANAQASLQDPETIDWDDPESAKRHLQADLDAQAAEGALIRIMALATLSTYKTALEQQGLPSDTATALSYAEEGAKAQLLPFVGQGLLVQDGTDYKLNLRLESGKLFVNGTEIANPMMAPQNPQ